MVPQLREGWCIYIPKNQYSATANHERCMASVFYGKGLFLGHGCKMPLSVEILYAFASIDENEHLIYQTLFEDHHKGEGIIVDTRLILRMRIERAEVP